MCVLFTEEVGGILELVFDEEGNLLFRTDADEMICYMMILHAECL